jgi:hypothetical protein
MDIGRFAAHWSQLPGRSPPGVPGRVMDGKGSSSCSVGTGGVVSGRATEGSADLAVTISPAADQAWPDAGRWAVDLIRGLATDAVRQAGPGLAEAAGGEPAVVISATGSEVARDAIAARVVSMAGAEWFTGQEPSYQEEGFGFTAERVADAARRSLARAAGAGQAESVRSTRSGR